MIKSCQNCEYFKEVPEIKNWTGTEDAYVECHAPISEDAQFYVEEYMNLGDFDIASEICNSFKEKTHVRD